MTDGTATMILDSNIAQFSDTIGRNKILFQSQYIEYTSQHDVAAAAIDDGDTSYGAQANSINDSVVAKGHSIDSEQAVVM